MPGYQPLPEGFTGDTADRVKRAQDLARTGHFDEAVLLYTEALNVALGVGLPGFVVGRLAMLFRRLGRYDDEIDLLERYRASHTDEGLTTRFTARLSKAVALAARSTADENGALASVRAVRARRPRRPR